MKEKVSSRRSCRTRLQLDMIMYMAEDEGEFPAATGSPSSYMHLSGQKDSANIKEN